jgi:hypothetical protein
MNIISLNRVSTDVIKRLSHKYLIVIQTNNTATTDKALVELYAMLDHIEHIHLNGRNTHPLTFIGFSFLTALYMLSLLLHFKIHLFSSTAEDAVIILLIVSYLFVCFAAWIMYYRARINNSKLNKKISKRLLMTIQKQKQIVYRESDKTTRAQRAIIERRLSRLSFTD